MYIHCNCMWRKTEMKDTLLINKMFLKSAVCTRDCVISTEDCLRWIQKQNNNINVDVESVPFSELYDWYFDLDGNLRHKSGKFFSIEGLTVNTNYGHIHNWQQPIINQPEIGFLGIITKEIDGVLYFLLQAKVEPGNINNVQLSPTLQATKSNYSQVHGGSKPKYLEYFQNANKNQIILDQLQSEQGARFYKKRNRNIIIKIEDDIILQSNFVWLTLGQIKQLAQYDNVVNMDTRTVISGIPFSFDDELCKNFSSFGLDVIKSGYCKNSITDILSWMTSLKCKYELDVRLMPLKLVEKWNITDKEISHADNKYFKIIGANIKISNREVQSWTQPLVQPINSGLTAFIVKRIKGVYHFLVQGKVELGNFDIMELAPTVQCVTGSYNGINTQPYVDYVLNAKKEQIKIDTMQSEEGGRFYQEQNRNMIVEADDLFLEDELPENYIWINHEQLMMFLHFNNYLNIQARSLLSLISLTNT